MASEYLSSGSQAVLDGIDEDSVTLTVGPSDSTLRGAHRVSDTTRRSSTQCRRTLR